AARATRSPGVLTPAILDVALGIVESRWVEDEPALIEDTETSGHHSPADVLRLLRYSYHRRGLTPEFNRAFALATSLAEGALYDHVDGGFFRSTGTHTGATPMPEK